MVHINIPCLNLSACSVIRVQMCLYLGISSILYNANLQTFIDKSLDVLPKFRQHAKYLQDFYLTLALAKYFAQNIKNYAKENGTCTKNVLIVLWAVVLVISMSGCLW